MTRALFDAISSLLPSKTVDPGDPSSVLASCIEKYLILSNPDEDTVFRIAGTEVYEAYCICCLHHLQSYVDLDASSAEEILLSVSHVEKLKSCVEFLICLGVYPYLDPGVSVPLEFRMEAHSCFRLPLVHSSSVRERNLLRFSKCLLQFRVCRAEQLRRLVSPALFLGDIIASLMQVGYVTVIRNSRSPDENTASQERSREARQLLWKLLCELPGSVAMKELLILQGGSVGSQKVRGAVKLPPAPVWLRKACGRLLSRLLVRGTTHSATTDNGAAPSSDCGVRSLLFASASLAPGVIGAPGGCINSLDPRLQPALAQGLAQILASRPSWLIGKPRTGQAVDQSAEQRYFQSIANQVLDLFTLKFTSVPTEPFAVASGTMSESVARFGVLVGVATVHEFCGRDFPRGKRLLLEPLLTVLYQCVTPENYKSPVLDPDPIPDCTDECELASVHQWNRMLDHVNSLVTCPSKSPSVLSELIRLSNPLFRLLTQIHLDRIDSLTDENESESTGLSQINKPVRNTVGSPISSLLAQMLSVGLEKRESRVAVLRSWSLLESHMNTTSMTDSIPLPRACHPRIRFRPPRPVHDLVQETTNETEELTTNSVTDITSVPFRCVLTRESVDWFEHPHGLSALIEATLDVINQFAPSPVSNIGASVLPENDDDKDDPTPVPLLETVFHGTAQPAFTADPQASCLPSDFFLSLIADLNECLSRILIEPPHSSVLVQINPVSVLQSHQTRAAVISSVLAASMLDRMGDRIWPQDPGQLVQLFEMTLERLSLLMGQAENEECCTFLAETLSQLLGILAFYANQIGPSSTCATSATRDQFARLLPVLDKLERIGQTRPTVLSDPQRELLHCLRVLIATRGAVKLNGEFNAHPGDANSLMDKPQPSNVQWGEQTNVIVNRPLIEECPEPSEALEQSAVDTNSSEEPVNPVLAEVFEQLDDFLIPVRGHALIMLSRLLESRDACIRGHEERIFQILVRQLNDKDSYIYLNAIRALSAMGLMMTDRVLHILLDKFSQPLPAGTFPVDARVEFQLKLGEAIIRVLRELGSVAPKYRTPVLNAMTVVTHASEPLVRAASLSNLAEFCRLLEHGMAPIMYELFALIELHLVQDPEPCVRQAAANLARSLLIPVVQQSGLPAWLPPDLLRDLNRLLSNRVRIERDSGVREQIEAALGQLDQCVRGSLFRAPETPQSLIKEIRVLRPFLD